MGNIIHCVIYMTNEQKKSFIIEGEMLVLEQRYPFRIAFMNDIHVGAQHGMFPEGFVGIYGAKETLNGGQKILWKYLNQYIGEMNKNKVNTFFVVGDLIAGKNYKDGGSYIMNVELPQQKEACAFLIAYICEKVPTIKNVYFLRGTPYHGSQDGSIEKDIAGILALKYDIKPKYLGEYTYLTLKYGKYKKVIWIAHPATGATMYPEMAMGRDIGHFLQAYAMGKLPKVDMIIRAHKHEYISLHKSTIRSVILPCWQFFCPYDKAVKWYSKWQPDIGGLILLADEQVRLRPWHFTYPNVPDPKRFLTLKHSLDTYGVNEKCLSKK